MPYDEENIRKLKNFKNEEKASIIDYHDYISVHKKPPSFKLYGIIYKYNEIVVLIFRTNVLMPVRHVPFNTRRRSHLPSFQVLSSTFILKISKFKTITNYWEEMVNIEKTYTATEKLMRGVTLIIKTLNLYL
ncbi:hypothetical protein HHI36_014721 [Cryptolaemus montrouzieri]|uniref:Uncharacterized protein n=1 Tax=Cryptolaemus montrouzieri TaxID=559131 RepID=A0ABD2N4A8_9CUCU